MPKQKNLPPLTAEQLELCPYGEASCRICRMSPEHLRDLHHRKMEEEFGYEKIRKYIKETYKMGVDYTDINHHFNKHVLGKHILNKVLAKRTDGVNLAIAKALEPISSSVKLVTSQDLEKAYEDLVKMAQLFVKRTRKLQEKIATKVDTRDESGALDKELDDINIMDLLEQQAKLNKEARDFIKDVSALRAPKVLVAQFLEAFIDDVIRELSIIVSNMCGDIQHGVLNQLSESGHPGIIGLETFAKIFRETALDYRDRMVNLKKQKMSDALAALQDLEKLI